GEENKIGLFHGSRLPARLAGSRFSLQRQDHQTGTHQTGDGLGFVESFLDTGNDASSSVTCLVGECDHKIGGYRNRSSYSAIKPLACSLRLCSIINISY